MKRNNQSLVAFEPGERITARPADVHSAGIYLANEDRMTESNYNEPATQYLTGWAAREDLQATLRSICPEVSVGRRFEYKKGKNTEAILSETDDVRAVGADFKRVEYSGDTVQDKVLNKGLTQRLDRDNMPAGDSAIERTAARLLRRIYRNELKRATVALLALHAGTAKTWGGTQDPDMDVLNAIDAAGDSSGLDANVVIFGSGAWLLRQASLRQQQKAGSFAGAMMTPADLVNLYGVERVEVISSRAKLKKGGSNSKILGNFVVALSLQDDPGTEDPSCLKRFTSPTDQGVEHAVYVEEHPKYVDVTVELYSKIVGVSSYGAHQLTIS